MDSPPYLPIGSQDPTSTCLAKSSWVQVAEVPTHSNDPVPSSLPFKYRKRDEIKTPSCLPPASVPKPQIPEPVQEKKPLDLIPEEPDEEAAITHRITELLKGLEVSQAEMRTLMKIDVNTPREEDLEKLIQRNSDLETTLAQLQERLRQTEIRAAKEAQEALEAEAKADEAYTTVKQAMDNSVFTLKKELGRLQACANVYRQLSGINLEARDDGTVKGQSMSKSANPFTFELTLTDREVRYRNLTKPSDHLDEFLKHEISGLVDSELPMLFRRMLSAVRNHS